MKRCILNGLIGLFVLGLRIGEWMSWENKVEK